MLNHWLFTTMLDQQKLNKFKKILLTIFSFLFIINITSCKNTDEENGSIQVVDSKNETISFNQTPSRVVILEASIAGIYKLAGGLFIGICDDCEEYGIDKTDKAIIGTAHYPNKELIIAQRPDLVIYSLRKQSHITVAESLKSSGIKTYACEIGSFDQYLYTLKQFTTLTNRTDLYQTYGENVKAKINQVKENASDKKQKKVMQELLK